MLGSLSLSPFVLGHLAAISLHCYLRVILGLQRYIQQLIVHDIYPHIYSGPWPEVLRHIRCALPSLSPLLLLQSPNPDGILIYTRRIQ